MSRRVVDLSFNPNELLWRRIEIGDIDKATGKVKPQRLRLPISVVRSNYGSMAQVPLGKWNGIAEIKAGIASLISSGVVNVALIDDPTDNNPGHALIALHESPHNRGTLGMRMTVLMGLAGQMTVVKMPVRV